MSDMTGSGRVTLVTGAGKGLGRAFAMACARRGDAVVVNNRISPGADNSADETAAAIRAEGGRAIAETSDITAPGASQVMVEAALDAFDRLDAVIFNAGANGRAARFLDTGEDTFEAIWAVNVTAQIALARAALPRLHDSPAGRMVFVSSSAGLYGIRGFTPYSASKGALNGFALALAREERRTSVRINVLAPYAATRMTGDEIDTRIAERFTPDAAAPLCAWMAGPDCARTGEIWTAGGGFARRAAMMEGGGARLPAAPSPGDIDRAGGFEDPHGHDGAEAAFADFIHKATEAGPWPY